MPGLFKRQDEGGQRVRQLACQLVCYLLYGGLLGLCLEEELCLEEGHPS